MQEGSSNDAAALAASAAGLFGRGVEAPRRHHWRAASCCPARESSTARDPRDIGLSIFTFRFHGAHGYAHNLGDLGWYIGQHLRLMAHWKTVLPNPVLMSGFRIAHGSLSSNNDTDAPQAAWRLERARIVRDRRGAPPQVGTRSATPRPQSEFLAACAVVKPVSRSKRNGGFGAHSGPSRRDSCRPAIRPF
jgi:hypothetical protein